MPGCGSHTLATYFMLIRMFVGLLCEQIHFICLAKTHTQQISAQATQYALGTPETQWYTARSTRKILPLKYYSTFMREYYSNECNNSSVSGRNSTIPVKKKSEVALQCTLSQAELTQHVTRCFSPKKVCLSGFQKVKFIKPSTQQHCQSTCSADNLYSAQTAISHSQVFV